MWTKVAPTEPGYYWWRDLTKCGNNALTVTTNCAGWCFPGNDMTSSEEELAEAGEFWSEPIMPPTDSFS